jgi:hypothetical protein
MLSEITKERARLTATLVAGAAFAELPVPERIAKCHEVAKDICEVAFGKPCSHFYPRGWTGDPIEIPKAVPCLECEWSRGDHPFTAEDLAIQAARKRATSAMVPKAELDAILAGNVVPIRGIDRRSTRDGRGKP